ncbi:hypothetical protein MNBD_NITROSPIRAE03-1304 [hydrothermal vent metagenome]|uniref:Uncharacterized protein n=1 Tax=hydrothermal vent metagenome TaxID=652676 RepID=A0A3B1D5L5_9ZZZZ
MKALTLLAKRIRETGNLFRYKTRCRYLKTELEHVKTFYDEKLQEMSLILEYKSHELERRVSELEEYKRETQHLLKILDSLESEKRTN